MREGKGDEKGGMGDLRGWWSRCAASMPGSRSSGPPAARGSGVPVGAAASVESRQREEDPDGTEPP